MVNPTAIPDDEDQDTKTEETKEVAKDLTMAGNSDDDDDIETNNITSERTGENENVDGMDAINEDKNGMDEGQEENEKLENDMEQGEEANEKVDDVVIADEGNQDELEVDDVELIENEKINNDDSDGR